jgi:cyclophilin family peptidyl-prolyl cis-trans isomerase
MRPWLLAGLALGSQQSTPVAAPRLEVSLEMMPPVWTEGDPLKLKLHIDNKGPGIASIPAEWGAGAGIVLREIRHSASASAPALQTVVPRPASAAPSTDPNQTYRVPDGGRLTLPVEIPSVSPPPGDAFEILFLSTQLAAGSTAIKIERCENLRNAKAVLETDRGIIVFELSPQTAPLATRNFARLAQRGFYDGMAFHRVARGSCIQAGDPESKTGDVQKIDGSGGNTFNGRALPLERSSANFEKGTVGLARIGDPIYMGIRNLLMSALQESTDEGLDKKLKIDWPTAYALQENAKSLMSSTSQFFICTTDAPQTRGKYSAFAKVVSGMDVVEAIEAGEVLGAKAETPDRADRPILPTRIRKITIVPAAIRASAPSSKPK